MAQGFWILTKLNKNTVTQISCMKTLRNSKMFEFIVISVMEELGEVIKFKLFFLISLFFL